MKTEIFYIPGKTWPVCYSTDDGWSCESPNGTNYFEKDGNFVPLLPLLELPWETARNLVSKGIDGKENCTNFPFNELIMAAMKSPSDYWPQLAIIWLEDGFPISTDIFIYLQEMRYNKKLPQKVRHRGFAVAVKEKRRKLSI